MTNTGVIHGRFHVLHHDHVKYLLAGKERCKHLVVGITNPDPTLTRAEEADSRRGLPEANPLTYFERYTMIRAALHEVGLAFSDFSVVPFPINLPALYGHYVPLDGTFFLTIYDEWGERKLDRFRKLGLKVEVLWRKRPEEKGLTATEVRRKIAEGEPWEHLVPSAVAELVKAWNIPERLNKQRAS